MTDLLQKMLARPDTTPHDAAHMMKVWGYTHLICDMEQVTRSVRLLAESEAAVHDIACPLCREKYGRADGFLQECESEDLLKPFLTDCGLSAKQIDRIIHVVSYHHSPKMADGLDFQILLEADYLTNAEESGYPWERIREAAGNLFQTASGLLLLKTIYRV